MTRVTAALIAAIALQRPAAKPPSPDPAALGTLRIGISSASGYRIETVPIETYVARVLAGEAARGSRPAALDALAITVRTFAIANLGRHRADGFDLCDQTHCQVVRAATAATEAAASRTAGQVLLHDGVPASIYYTASCGGRTEVPSAVWPGAPDPPYLPSKRDDACAGGPVWRSEIDRGDLLRALQAAGFRGDRLRSMRIASRDGSGRVARLALDGLTPGAISGQDLRVAVGRTLGWQQIRSAAFDLAQTAGGYRFDGRGAGHGVGLCVIGSARLAADGESAAAILARYFPGLDVAGVAGVKSARVGPTSPVLASLPEGDEGERARLDDVVRRARDEIAAALGVEAPAHVPVRVHPTIDSFERATGRPWFTLGAADPAHGIDLLPLAALRERGLLERTIRRELVHVMADADLARRPRWVSEGAALHFSEPSTSAVQRRVDCPRDAELLNPVSAGALANALARARACFDQQIARGRTWKDVR